MTMQAVTFLKASWPYQGGDKVGLPASQAESLRKRDIVAFDAPPPATGELGDPPSPPTIHAAGAPRPAKTPRGRQE